jgi:hypothetical protein
LSILSQDEQTTGINVKSPSNVQGSYGRRLSGRLARKTLKISPGNQRSGFRVAFFRLVRNHAWRFVEQYGHKTQTLALNFWR